MISRRTYSKGSIALVLACLAAIILTATADSIGLTWDEPSYINAAQSYAGWFGVLVAHPVEAFTPQTITRYWSVGAEHPPVLKIWSGLVWLISRHVLDELTASRLGAILLVALLVALLYLLIAEEYGNGAGMFAVAALLTMPRFFFHAHLSALDVPVSVAWFAVIFVFWKTVDRKGWGWGIVWGVLWGFAAAVKLNGVFIPIALWVWMLLFRRSFSTTRRLLLMVPFSALTFLLVWPWLYYQTWERLIGYANFHLQHFVIGQWYLGRYYAPPPWHFVFVMLWAVVPLSVTVLFVAGIARAGTGRRDRGLAWLLIINAFVSISPFILGKTLLYDNERLFMPVFPFLAGLAGVGFSWLISKIPKPATWAANPPRIAGLSALLGVVLLAPQSITMAGMYPHLLSYYSEGVGGLSGATKLGLETTYWCESFAEALPYINTHAEPGDVIWTERTAYQVLEHYQTIGWLREDLRIRKSEDRPFPLKAQWYIFQYRQTQFGEGGEENYLPLRIFNDQKPVVDLRIDGIPIMKLYGSLE